MSTDTATPAAGGFVARDLLGAWTLVSYVETPALANGPEDAVVSTPPGLLFYSASGFVSAQIATTDIDPNSNPLLLSYAGRFTFDDGVVKHHVAIATNRAWIGSTLARHSEMPNTSTLVLHTVDPIDTGAGPSHVKLTWARADETAFAETH